ncbi:MAG: T9SS type B sorting domain-containing protein, partial [Crocinitomicaceae bacterium]
GSSDGIATVYASAGTPTYSYQLGAGALQTNSDFTGLAAGLYSVTLSDINNCVASNFISLTNPPVLSITSVSSTDALCFGSSEGTISIVAAGGTPNYQYSYDGGINYVSASTMTGLTAGSYHVYVRDTNLCQIDMTNVIISQPTPVDFASIVISNATCFGFNDGSITVTPTGGTAPYSYTWSANAATGNSNTATGLVAGSYSVTITDDHLCTVDSIGILVTSPPQITITSIVTDSVNCFGGSDGSVVITANNAVNYTITSSGGAVTGPQAAFTFNGLAADTYTLQLTDINGCTMDSSFQLFEATPISITSVVITTNLCNGDNTGGITISATGGTGTYQYSFDGGATFGASNSNLALPAGSYTVSVRDINLCVFDSIGVVITEPTALVVDSMVISSATCYSQCNGSITANISGGTGAYTYSWTNITPNPGNTNAVTNLCDGLYDLEVMDANGCILDTLNNAVAEPPQIVFITLTTDSVNCFGGSDGIIDINATNTTNYIISGPVNLTQTTGTFTGLPAGVYQIELQDINGCSVYNDTTLYEPTLFTISTGNDTTICANSSANLMGFGNGGIAPYTFTWTSFGPGANQVVSPAATTNYYLTATDANGCAAGPDSTLVTLFDPLTTTALNDTTLCAGGTAPVSIAVLTGVPTYSYTWAPAPVSGQGTPYAVLSAGSYSVTVTDQCDAQVIENIVVTTFSEPTLNITGVNSGCAPHTIVVNSNNATISNCVWNFGNGITANSCGPTTYTYNNAGTYSISFSYTTSFGCQFDTTIVNPVTVSEPPVASFTYSPNEPNLTFNTVEFTNTSAGGSQYYWDFDGAGFSTTENPSFTFPSDVANDYNTCLTVTDNYTGYSCSSTYCIIIPMDEGFSLYVPNAFTPDNDEHNNVFKAVVLGAKEGSFVMQIFDRWGELIFESHDPEVGWDGTYNNIVSQDGSYVWKIQVKMKNVDDVVYKHGHVMLLR